MKPLPEKVQHEINALAAWYADHAKLGLSVRDDMQAIARLTQQETARECAEICSNLFSPSPPWDASLRSAARSAEAEIRTTYGLDKGDGNG